MITAAPFAVTAWPGCHGSISTACASSGYAFQEEILYRCRRAGCQFAETPIVFRDRRYGTSKINWRESVTALWIIFRLGLENLVASVREPSFTAANEKPTDGKSAGSL